MCVLHRGADIASSYEEASRHDEEKSKQPIKEEVCEICGLRPEDGDGMRKFSHTEGKIHKLKHALIPGLALVRWCLIALECYAVNVGQRPRLCINVGHLRSQWKSPLGCSCESRLRKVPTRLWCMFSSFLRQGFVGWGKGSENIHVISVLPCPAIEFLCVGGVGWHCR